MPALTTLAIDDRATPTPVTHTYTPMNRDNPNQVRLREAGSVTDADSYVTLGYQKLRDGSHKMTAVLIKPVVQTETLNGITSVKNVRQGRAAVEFRFSGQSTVQERKDVIGLMANALLASKTVVNDAFVNAEGWF